MNAQRSLCLELDLEALEANFLYLKKACMRGQKFIASVKANAYGLGVIPISKALQDMGVTMFATGNIDEARQMRGAGISGEIMLFAFGSAEESRAAAEQGFVPSITSIQAAQYLSGNTTSPISVYLKVDAGLGRLGIPISGADKAIAEIAALPGISIRGIYTHVPFPDDKKDWANRRLQLFNSLLDTLSDKGIKPEITQAMASCCLLEGLDDNCNAVCVGHALYGLSPFSKQYQNHLNFIKPVVKSIATRIIHIGHHTAGDDMAIAGVYDAPAPKSLGVLAVGTSHGMSKSGIDVSPRVLVGGKFAPIVSVSLEHTTIDLDHVPACAVGDAAVLVGSQGNMRISLNDFADSLGVTPLGALMQFSTRNAITLY